jgi:hypothetical protein
MRERWVQEKGLTVFTLFSPDHDMTEVDLFVRSPFDFEAAFNSAFRAEVAPNVSATFVGLEDLLAMKQRAGRPQDMADVQQLRRPWIKMMSISAVPPSMGSSSSFASEQVRYAAMISLSL